MVNDLLMRTEYRFKLALRNGMHARPASMLADSIRAFSSRITIAKEPGGAPVDARSVLSVIGLDVKHEDGVLAVADGSDAEEAIAALREYIENRLAEGEEAATEGSGGGADGPSQAVQLPIGLRGLGVPTVYGRPVCAGIGIGVAVVIDGLSLPAEVRDALPGSARNELAAARRAIDAVRKDLQARAGGARARLEADLLRAHADIAGDPALWGEIERRIGEGATAARAVVGAAEYFAGQLRCAASQYIRDRVVDIQDVCLQLLDRLTGGRVGAPHVNLERDSVVFAETLTANQLLRMERRFLKGLVLGHIGATSHTVIIARSLGVPTLIGVANAGRASKAGEGVVVDAVAGCVLSPVTPEIARYYERERRTQRRRIDRLAPVAGRVAVTVDGVRLEVGANASSAEEVAAAVECGADGIGLFRTEMLFLERAGAPSEDEQYEVYSAAVAAAAGRPVIIRTFDIGGDKPAPYLAMPKEENPFLGCRGLRLYERHPDLLRSQLRAVVRASAGGPVKVMAPMVATPSEAEWFREQVRAAQAEVRAAGAAFDEKMPIGVMIEVPAAGLVMDQLCDVVDFFSVGTNDLCQYWMAVDRGNKDLAALYNPRGPSFLRLLRLIVAAAKSRGKWIGVCGEMAGDGLNLPLMLGLGVDEISVAPGDVLPLKVAVSGAAASRCREALEKAAACRNEREVEEVLRDGSLRQSEAAGIVDADIIEMASDAATKEEAIKDAVDLLYVAGRTERPRDVEEAVWDREKTYSTGLGFGFAVPHCKTGAVSSASLAVLRPGAPVEWGSMDGEPVRMVLLLVIPESDTTGTHMKVFAQLARRLMHEAFRERMLGASDKGAVEACLREELGLDGVVA